MPILGNLSAMFLIAAMVMLLCTDATAHKHASVGEQPLSKIAIHRAVFALDVSARIEARPVVLGLKGEDTEWVDVNFNTMNPQKMIGLEYFLLQISTQVEPIASSVPYMAASGNHERGAPGSGSFYDSNDSGGEWGVLPETMLYVPAENRAKFWYSTDYGMFHICIADSEHDWREGSRQYNFIESCLASADRQKQPWLIFIAHSVLAIPPAICLSDHPENPWERRASRSFGKNTKWNMPN